MSYDADLKLFIDGVWKSGEGRDTHNVINPATGSGIADVPLASKADIDEALAAADRAWPIWRATEVEKRSAILAKTGDLLRERADHIGAIMTQEQGKPLGEARAKGLGRRIRSVGVVEVHPGEERARVLVVRVAGTRGALPGWL